MRLHSEGYVLRFCRVESGEEPKFLEYVRNAGKRAFLMLGRFDALILEPITRLNQPAGAALPHLLSSSELVAIPTAQQAGALESLAQMPCLVVSLIRLRPVTAGLPTFQDEVQMEQLLTELSPHTALLHSGGSAEIVAVQGGSQIDFLLRTVTHLRQKLATRIAATTTMIAIDPDRSGEVVSDQPLHVQVGVRCRPPLEGVVLREMEGYEKRDAYGWQDFVLVRKTNRLGKALDDVLRLRRETSALDTAMAVQLDQAGDPFEGGTGDGRNPYGDRIRDLVAAQIRLLQRMHLDDAQLRSLLLQLGSDLLAAAKSAEIGALGFEHVASFSRLCLWAGQLARGYEDPSEEAGVKLDIRRLAHYIALSISQRSSGGDPHFELGSSALSLATQTQGRLAVAASAAPWFTLQSFGKGKVWPFCIAFGSQYSPGWANGALLMPDTSLKDVLNDWWRTNHEAGHAASQYLRFYREILPQRRRAYVERLSQSVDAGSYDFRQFANEIFSQWFDYLTAFSKNRDEYQKAIWTSWLQVPRVGEDPAQYLARSLALYVYDYLEQWGEHQHSKLSSETYLSGQLDALMLTLSGAVPGFREYASRITEEYRAQAITVVDSLSGLILATLDEMEQAIYAAQPEYAELDLHAQSILAGDVVTDPIPNPAALLSECRARIQKEFGGRSAIQQDMAAVLSLWNCIQLRMAEQVTSAAGLVQVRTTTEPSGGGQDD